MGQRRSGLLCAVAFVLALDLLVVALKVDDEHARQREEAAAARAASLPMISVDSPLPPPPTTAPPTTAPPETTTTAPPPPPAPSSSDRAQAWTVGPYIGTGVWIDVYDWTVSLSGGTPRVGVDQIDQMADHGIQTIFIQTAHRRSPADVIEPERLLPMIDRAHARGMSVIAWYLPELLDTHADHMKLLAQAALPVDGLGVDIESRAVGDHAERTRRLLELSQALRNSLPGKAISAITLDPVHLQVVNPSYWPGFPWPEIGSLYDVIVPMAYWSWRNPEWKQGAKYVADNIDRIRISTGRDIPIHVAGGIADGISLDDVVGMIVAIQSRGAVGGSLYDWSTSTGQQWELLKALRVG
jgi:hypothetical protein